jgi:AcrR family transcriptional regulator
VTVSPARQQAMDALLDAAEALLIEVGYAAVTTRKLAERAGVNHGLVHYYFGSMEEVLLQTLERHTKRLIDRQKGMYGTEGPFLEKWRTAMAYLGEDIAAGYPKVWYELQAMAWNHPEFRERVVAVNSAWRAVLTEAFSKAMRAYAIDRRRFPVDGVVSLVMTFNLGLQLEQLIGVDTGHAELLAMIDRWLSSLEPDQPERPRSKR